MRANCGNCKHSMNSRNCRYDFRMASGAAGQAVDDIQDVYWCQDYAEDEDNTWDNNDEEDL